MNEEQSKNLIYDVKEIKDALLGTFDKPGLISIVNKNTSFISRFKTIAFSVLSSIIVLAVIAVITLI